MSLKKILDSKPLYYKKIDYNRMPKAYDSIKAKLNLPKIIHIVGTNGKGSTGRFLAHMLYKAGYKVGHYISPHIVKFNERIWINGKDIDDKSLEIFNEKLLKILPKEFVEDLSYFEYTTLLAAISFEGVDFAIMEAGLGGEFDATNVFEKRLSLIATIGLDHQAFLGDSIKKIALTKIRSIQKDAILGHQKYKSIKKIAMDIAKSKNCNLYLVDDLLNKDEKYKIKNFIVKKNYPIFFENNFSLAYSAKKILEIDLDINSCNDLEIFGRFQKIAKNIIIDVGHNPLAAKALFKSLKKDTVLIYNAYKDKDYKEVLKILKPKIKRVEIIDIDDDRVVDKDELKEVLKSLKIDFKEFKGLKSGEQYFVFGSFRVVEKFLKGGFSAS